MITSQQHQPGGPPLQIRKQPGVWTRLRRSDSLKGYLYISPWLIGFLLLGLWPIIQTFYYSFTKFNLFNDPTFIGIKNYQDILTKDPIFLQACVNMLIYVVCSTVISIAGGLGLALLLNQRFPGNHFFRTVLYVPSLLVGVAIAKLFKAIFAAGENGLANEFLGLFHVAPVNWLGDYNRPWIGLIAMIAVNFWFIGGTMLIFLAGLKGISQTYYEAARIDGAGKWAIFSRITVPLLAPVIVFNSILTLIGHIQVFDTPLVFASSQGTISTGNPLGYHNSLAVFLTYIYRSAFISNNYGYASALSVIVFIITLILTLIVLTTIRFSHYSEQDAG
ncbi:ABC transporter permease [Dictyobacter alpinus]|uniref:ABC transporter permease n=1 Tax=Dictyobacter alpinus TaxID=2014873 RepID=A0A402BGA8_9CHLR|nr:sugar ABC transporter permease [Dictyobacter alpinus]GCE30307.1 ABC transporter permease [Dictyobacter alpinus]GCE30339.1 ABC transporter permease [Dictyobacter alpinus]